MAERDDDGGPAFPVVVSNSSGGSDYHQVGNHEFQFYGMTLRDHFAGLALAAMIGNTDKDAATRGAKGVPILARFAYEYADAMLMARAASAQGEKE